MTCPSCGRSNGAGARFCGGCGASLAPKCRACGTQGSPGARFCEGCGAPLASEPAEKAIARKIVTVVFADLIGSVSLHERQDAESARRVIDRYHRAMKAAVEIHGGRVVQLLGDGVLAAFGVPTVAEDDALRAARAAFGMHRAFRELARELGDAMAGIGLRVALNTGELVVSDDETAVIGDATNVAARLQSEARDGEVIVGEATQRLIGELVTLAPLGSFALKGRRETVGAYRLVSLDRPTRALARFVGRDDELRRLLSVYDAARTTPTARLAVLLGSPGLGKSRLLAELMQRVSDRATVLAARCDEARGATFAPLAEALRGLLGTDAAAGGAGIGSAIDALVEGSDEDRARIGAGITALLAGAPAPPEETFFVVRRFLAALAATRPVVLAIDDLHWAEPLLLDLIEHLVQWTGNAPLLIVAAARPELREARSSLATRGPLVADVLTLGGLDASSATRLAANVIGASELPAALAGRVLAASEGNPLFVSELVRMLVHDGTLRREADRWVTTVALAELDMPPTIGVLLAARIERLRPEERAVLERAAVVGRHFSRAAVAHLLPRDAANLDARLEALRRSELIEPDTGWFLGDPGLRFHHALIRDAAYRRVLRETRAELHERFADWVATRAGDSLEHDETIGWHLEQALDNRRELGPLDARATALGERAARHLGAAGQRALARDDLALAAGLLGRALACLPAEHDSRAQLALDWCEALLSAGEVAPAQAAVDELGRLAAGSERLLAWHTCFRGQLAALTDPQSLRATAREVAAAAETLVRLDDSAGQAKAHFVHASALARLGEIGAGEAALDRALAAARRAQDRRRANAVLTGVPQAALWGPSPVTRASGRCLDVVRVLRITQGAPAVEAVALRCQAVLEALRGRTDAARRMVASSRAMVEELGLASQLFEADVFAGHIELLEGDAAAAERCLRSAYEGLRDQGLGIDAARAAALLGRALLAQGRAPEAEVLSHESESLAGDDLKAAMGWRGVRAEALARRAEHGAALELAREAAEIASRTDNLLDHADARVALAATLRAAGRRAEADTEERRALELWERKGATLLVERSRGTPPSAEAEIRSGDAPTGFDPLGRARAPLVRRRVDTNRATAATALFQPAAGFAAIEAQHRADFKAVVHPLGIVVDRDDVMRWWRMYFADRGAETRFEPVAALGDALALFHRHWSAAESGDGDFQIGAFSAAHYVLHEVDVTGRIARVDLFEGDHLGDGLVRLYERHAELLPEGPQRARAQETARTVASLPLKHAPDVGRLAASLAENVEFVDERPAGPGTLRGSEAVLRSIRAIAVELSEGFTARTEDVLAASPEALLVRNVTSGIVRASGGAFERPLLSLVSFTADGRLARWEQFDVDREAAALARFDALASQPRAGSRPPVRANLATAWADRCCAAVAARDLAAIEALHSPELADVLHTTGVTLDFREMLEVWRRALREARAEFALSFEPIATLGDRLGLFFQTWSGAGVADRRLDAGPYQHDAYAVFEVDAQGRLVHSDEYRPDALADAVARLYARYGELLPEGEDRARAAALARWVGETAGPMQLDGAIAGLSPDVIMRDLRTAGYGEVRGAAAYRAALATLFEMAESLSNRMDAVLALRDDALLARITNVGRDRHGGGEFERPFLMLFVGGADGGVSKLEQFDVGHEAQALARFDELRGEVSKASPFENAAWRSVARSSRLFGRTSWEVWSALFATDYRNIDRRGNAHHELDRDEFLRSYRPLFEMASSGVTLELIATRGERLTLTRSSWLGADRAVGASEIEVLVVNEVNARGEPWRAVLYDPADVDAAYADLDARWTAQAGPDDDFGSGFLRAFAARDWAAVADEFRPDFTLHDHRPLGWGTLDLPKWLESLRAFGTLSPDARVRIDHVRGSARCLLAVLTWVGTREGGAFEDPRIVLTHRDESGRVFRFDQYGPEQVTEAFAHFQALTSASAPGALLENAATRALARFEDAWHARDWPAVVACYAPGHRMDDRRKLVRLEVGGASFLSNERMLFDLPQSRWRSRALSVFGERVALFHVEFTGGADDTGPMSVEVLDLVEIDSEGRRSALAVFDVGDERAALAEGIARGRALEPELEPALAVTLEYLAAFNAHDRERLRATLAPDLVVDDHRLVGPGRIVGTDAYLEGVTPFWTSSPDQQIELVSVLGCAAHGSIAEVRTYGSGFWSDGGEFEVRLVSFMIAERGRITRQELFELTDAAAALARFAELRPDPLRIPPNAATRASDRHAAAVETQDWDAWRELCSPELVFEDRRRAAHTRGGREMLLESNRVVAERGVKAERTVLATAGDRIALERCVFARRGRAGLEVEVLRVYEVDAGGRISAEIYFDPGDRRAASVELLDRWARGAPENVRRTSEVRRAVLARDVSRLHEILPPDFVYIDHRLGRPGRIEGAREYERWMASLLEVSPDAIMEPLYFLEADERGTLSVSRAFGTSNDGGVFENVSVLLATPRSSEVFDLHDLERARARFAELRPDPLRIPPNAASRAGDRIGAIMAARDWDALRALASDEFVFEDRQRRSLVRGGAETLVRHLEFVSQFPRRDARRELLATAGEHLALERHRFNSGSEDVEFEGEFLRLCETAPDGRLLAMVYFDPDDRRGASRELLERWERGVPEPTRRTSAGRRAVLDRDASRLHELVPPDFVYIDHRLGGPSRIEGAREYQHWVASLLEHSPDAIVEPLYFLEIDERGTLYVGHTFGTSVDGGAYENVWVRISAVERTEIFDVHDLERARARFAELRADPLRIPSNDAFRIWSEVRPIVAARDWNALRALAAPDFVFDDRQRRSQVRGDIETFVRNMEFVASWPKRIPHMELVATAGDRLALDRLRYSGEAGDSAFEGEFLRVIEVDAAGKLRAIVYFDADERRGASLELLDRWLRGAPEQARRTGEVRRAILERDPSRVSEVLPSDFVYVDHRLGRPGRIEGAQAFERWVVSLLDSAPDAIIEVLYFLEVDDRGTLSVGHTFGTSVDGAAFENVWLSVSGPGYIEYFEVHDLERARARFAELRADPLRVPQNAAYRAWTAVGAIMAARDWPALRALATPGFEFEDRQRHSLVRGGIDTYARNLEAVTSWPERAGQRELIATAGEHLALERLHFSGKTEAESRFEGEFLRVVEIDAAGKLRAIVYFDTDDRAAAFVELAARSQAGERSGRGQAPIFAFTRALRVRDPDAVAAVLAADFVFQDHKALGFGTLAREDFLVSLRAEIELAPGATRETVRVIALASNGALALGRRMGTLRDGGDFEVVSLTLTVTDGDRYVTRFEVFDPAAGARARARFRELCPDAVFAPD